MRPEELEQSSTRGDREVKDDVGKTLVRELEFWGRIMFIGFALVIFLLYKRCP